MAIRKAQSCPQEIAKNHGHLKVLTGSDLRLTRQQSLLRNITGGSNDQEIEGDRKRFEQQLEEVVTEFHDTEAAI